MHADVLDFFTDASLSKKFGYGAVFKHQWLYGIWGSEFIEEQSPSIEFLELFALTAGILTWASQLTNVCIVIFCDNEAVVNMVNNLTSKCRQCIKLIRLLVEDNLLHNRRVFVRHVRTKLNQRADALSRLQFDHFWRHSPPGTNTKPDTIIEKLWPIEKIWFNDKL